MGPWAHRALKALKGHLAHRALKALKGHLAHRALKALIGHLGPWAHGPIVFRYLLKDIPL